MGERTLPSDGSGAGRGDSGDSLASLFVCLTYVTASELRISECQQTSHPHLFSWVLLPSFLTFLFNKVLPLNTSLLSWASQRTSWWVPSNTSKSLWSKAWGLGGSPISHMEQTVCGAEDQREDTVLSWLQRTLRWGCIILHSPGIIFHAIHVLPTPILGMGKPMLQPYLLRARMV